MRGTYGLQAINARLAYLTQALADAQARIRALEAQKAERS
jgi:hypothetical protein